MRTIIDCFKDISNNIDGLWIDWAGWPIDVVGVLGPGRCPDEIYHCDSDRQMTKYNLPTFYGFYTLPEARQMSVFGIDSPDEMTIEVSPNVAHILGDALKVGLVLKTAGSQWVVSNISYQHHWFYGKRRLNLHCQMYVESVTTNGKASPLIAS